MSKTGIYRADEYESAPEDDPDTLISRNKASSRKKKDNTNKEKKAKKNLKPRKSNTPRKQKKNLRERSSSCPPGQTGKDLWLAAVKARSTVGLSGPHRPESPRHKTPTEFWIDTLRRTGAGRSTESTSMNTFSGLRRPNEADMPYLSTSAYTRQMVGVEKPKKYDNPTVKPPSGTPYYKSQEEYYDQIIELKKQIQNLNQDYGALKAKLRRVEEDNIKKEKEIDGLLHPSKNEELRRTLGDKRPESGAVIHSLKQKIMKLETQLRDKESAYIKLQTDLKTTKIEEMKVQLEACFHEIVRLQQSKETGMEKISRGKSESHKMDKAVKETMIRLNKQIEQLKSENQSLRDDLNRDINNVPSEYEDMNRKQLLQAVKKLEKKLKSGGDVDSLMSSEGKAQSGPVEGKLHLSGTVENRLEQLDQRETELLEENKKLHETIKRLKVYRKRYEEKEKEVSMLREDLEQRGMVSSRTPRPVSSRPPSGRRTSVDQRAQQSPRDLPSARSPREQGRAKSPKLRSSESDNIDIEKKVEQLRQKHAAKAIQKNWSKYRQRKATHEENRKINEFRENQAAKKIQRGWTDYKYRKHDKDLDEATELIQSALRGHKSRKSRMKTYRYDDEEMYDDDDESYDNAVNLIQSSFSGHVNRKKRLKNKRQYEEDSEEFSMGHNSDISFSQRPASSGSYRNRPSSALSRGSSSSKGGYGSTSKAKTTTASYSQRQSTFEHDDDDDIAF